MTKLNTKLSREGWTGERRLGLSESGQQADHKNVLSMRQLLQMMQTLASTVELRDQYTGDHTWRVTTYASLLAEELKISTPEKEIIWLGTPLHDIGKIGIDDAILRKPEKLTPSEFEIMKTHTVKGVRILEQIPEFAEFIPIVRSHHERWDGLGYPDGTVGEKTPFLARIVAVADTFDAMTSNRIRPKNTGVRAGARRHVKSWRRA